MIRDKCCCRRQVEGLPEIPVLAPIFELIGGGAEATETVETTQVVTGTSQYDEAVAAAQRGGGRARFTLGSTPAAQVVRSETQGAVGGAVRGGL
jgi:hypothetical protein